MYHNDTLLQAAKRKINVWIMEVVLHIWMASDHFLQPHTS